MYTCLYGVPMPLWAIILRTWPDVPVYHRARRGVGAAGMSETTCGRTVSPYTPWLPMKHVVKFGRPCKGCFPE